MWRKKPNDPLPVWMDPVELSQLLAIVHAVAPRRCLEWGSGGSTKALLAACPWIETYVSIEHNEEWYRKVRDIVVDPRLRLVHVAPDEPLTDTKPDKKARRAWELRAEHERAVMKAYVDYPGGLGLELDFVLVDGRARRFCIEHGFAMLRAGGVLVVHDAQRTEYHDALARCGEPTFLHPWVQGQICLVRKD